MSLLHENLVCDTKSCYGVNIIEIINASACEGLLSYFFIDC